MFKLLLSFLLVPFVVFAYQHDLAICVMFQDEGPYMKEWIDFHRSVGVKHFFLYNNNSTDNFRKVLQPYIKKGLVELIEWPSQQLGNDFSHHSFEVQTGAYNNAIERSRGKVKWLALIDLDEFIVPVKERTIVKVLEKHFRDVAGLCVNWQCYGTSHVSRVGSNKSMLRQLKWKMKTDHPHNRYFKSIVRVDKTAYCPNPHFCVYFPGHYHVNTNRERFDMANPGVYVDKIRINHYWTRDEHFLNKIKIPRYVKWGGSSAGVLSLANLMNAEKDPIILKYLRPTETSRSSRGHR